MDRRLWVPRRSQDDHSGASQTGGPASNSASEIFSLHNSSWKAKQHGGARVKHVAAVGHVLWIATDAGRVVRWHLGSGDEQVPPLQSAHCNAL